jgi:hemerythrin
MPEIDAEHRELFGLGSEMHRALVERAGAATVRKIFDALIAAADAHFAEEERVMRETGYPSYAWHKRRHDDARARARSLGRRIRRGDAEAGMEFLDFLAGWMRDHLAVADRMMASYVRNARRSHAVLPSKIHPHI